MSDLSDIAEHLEPLADKVADRMKNGRSTRKGEKPLIFLVLGLLGTIAAATGWEIVRPTDIDYKIQQALAPVIEAQGQHEGIPCHGQQCNDTQDIFEAIGMLTEAQIQTQEQLQQTAQTVESYSQATTIEITKLNSRLDEFDNGAAKNRLQTEQRDLLNEKGRIMYEIDQRAAQTPAKGPTLEHRQRLVAIDSRLSEIERNLLALN